MRDDTCECIAVDSGPSLIDEIKALTAVKSWQSGITLAVAAIGWVILLYLAVITLRDWHAKMETRIYKARLARYQAADEAAAKAKAEPEAKTKSDA